MKTYYHFLDSKPYLNQIDMPLELELLASKLLKSGLIRIDAIEKTNFIRYKSSAIKNNRVFSKRELYDPRLINRTKRILSQVYQNSNNSIPTNKIIDKEILRLRKEISK